MQVLFVLKDHRIAFWKFQRGRLVRGSLNGNSWSDYTSAYWSDWSAVNQSGDAVDAVLLSDQPVEKLGELPSWFHVPECQASSWKVDTLAKLANDSDFVDVGIMVCVGSTRCELAQRSWAENFWLYPSKGSLASAVLELEAKRVAEVRRAEDEARKREIEEKRRKEEETRIAEVNRRNAETISAAKNRQQMSNAHPDGDVVQLWISRVGEKSKTSVFEILVNAVPRAGKYPDWVRVQINDVARTGQHLCLDRQLNAAVAETALAELRKVGADGYLRRGQDTTQKETFESGNELRSPCAAGGDDSNQSAMLGGAADERVKLWLSRVSTQSVQMQFAISTWLPKESSFDTFRIRDRIKRVAQTGKAVCLSNRVSLSVANKILAELRKCGADGFVTK